MVLVSEIVMVIVLDGERTVLCDRRRHLQSTHPYVPEWKWGSDGDRGRQLLTHGPVGAKTVHPVVIESGLRDPRDAVDTKIITDKFLPSDK